MKIDLKQYLSIREIAAYTENGCNIQPAAGKKLYRTDYWDALKHHPRHGQFGSMSTYDGLDAAKELMKESYPNGEIKLGIPCLVFEA